MKLIAAAITGALLLAGCEDEQMRNLPPNTRLPELPAGLTQCLNRAGVPVPRGRALTVEQVERLWSQDRLTIVAMRQCGGRIIAYYNTLRSSWR